MSIDWKVQGLSSEGLQCVEAREISKAKTGGIKPRKYGVLQAL